MSCTEIYVDGVLMQQRAGRAGIVEDPAILRQQAAHIESLRSERADICAIYEGFAAGLRFRAGEIEASRAPTR